MVKNIVSYCVAVTIAARQSNKAQKERSKVPRLPARIPASLGVLFKKVLIIDNKNIKKLKCINRNLPIVFHGGCGGGGGDCCRVSFCDSGRAEFPSVRTKKEIMDGRNCKAI